MQIYQQNRWPEFTWNNESLLPLLSKVRNLQGRILGRMESLGFDLRKEAFLETLTIDVIKSTEIEGEFLDPAQVRSSVARRLGMDYVGVLTSDRNIEGIVDLMMDATHKFQNPLTSDRLFGWHSALFPSGRSSLYKITVGAWRMDTSGPMQVVSGPMGKEKIHYQAPDSSAVPSEMDRFLAWFNSEDEMEPVIKAAVGHLWFVTIHPFDDGNGRIARALTDMLLARSDNSSQRFYSMSAQIRKERKGYYDVLEHTQRGGLEITRWLIWFLDCLHDALVDSDSILTKVLYKAQFWRDHAAILLNDRQRMMLNKMLDGFEGKLTTSKWAKISKCSQDTALRDIQDLIYKQILVKEPSGGRSTNYELKQKMPAGNIG
jgi:Uncharacterized conserved protein